MVVDGGDELGLGKGQQAMEGGPSGRVGGRAEGRRAVGQGPEAAAQKDLTWLHLGPGVGGASGQRKPERWGAGIGLHYPQWGAGLLGSSLSKAPTSNFSLSKMAFTNITAQLGKVVSPSSGLCSPLQVPVLVLAW